VPLGEEVYLDRMRQRRVSLIESRYFTAIASSSVKTVADRHRLTVTCEDEFTEYININDLKLEPPKYEVLVIWGNFRLGLRRTFQD